MFYTANGIYLTLLPLFVHTVDLGQ